MRLHDHLNERQLAASDLQSTMAMPALSLPASLSPPIPNGHSPPVASPALSTISAFASATPATTPAPRPKAKGLQLGATKVPGAISARSVPAELAAELEEADEAEIADAWGGDLMDVHEDAGDWGAFESGQHEEDALGAMEPPKAASSTTAPAPKPVVVATTTVRAQPTRPSTVSPPRSVTSNPARATAAAMRSPPVSAPSPAPPQSMPGGDVWGEAVWEYEEPEQALPAAASPPPAATPMTKEEKAAEMARRKEERKQVRVHPNCDFELDLRRSASHN